ncbi:MAG: aldose 1-epimerase family protein [Clostridiales bacterium]|nr:aldose 1-epimerase family protein [Clostridiales bacterium]
MICLQKNGAEMEIALLGAEMRAYRSADGKNRIWSGDPAVWKSTAPVLFPAIGAVKDGKISIAGKDYAVPRHGFAKFLDFEVTEQGEDFVTLTLHENAETKKVYPFDFALSVTHRFLANGFETRYTVENHTGRVMPFMIGGHPGFVCPMNPGERFEDYVIRFDKPEKVETSLCTPDTHLIDGSQPVCLGDGGRTLALNHADFDRLDTYIFEGLASRSVELVHKDTGHGLRFGFDMDVLAIWSMPGKNAPYVCIEPWQGAPARVDETGRFEDKPWHVELGVGQAYTCGYRMELM